MLPTLVNRLEAIAVGIENVRDTVAKISIRACPRFAVISTSLHRCSVEPIHLSTLNEKADMCSPRRWFVLRFHLFFALLQARLQSPSSGPLGPTVGSESGKTKCAIRSAMAAVGASRQMSQHWLGGYAPTTRKSDVASRRQWPVPVGRTATSPARTLTSRPPGPPRISLAEPAANPSTSCAVE